MPLFTVAEARQFDKRQIADEAKYPDAAIAAARDGLAARFARICGVAFEPTGATATVDGARDGATLLPHPLVTAITAVERWDGASWVALAADRPDTLRIDGYRLVWPGGWPYRGRTVRLTYTHGYDPTPHDIARAALIATVNELVSTDISERATSWSDPTGAGTFRLATAGMGRASWFGLPLVDAVLAEYRALYWRPGVG